MIRRRKSSLQKDQLHLNQASTWKRQAIDRVAVESFFARGAQKWSPENKRARPRRNTPRQKAPLRLGSRAFWRIGQNLRHQTVHLARTRAKSVQANF